MSRRHRLAAALIGCACAALAAALWPRSKPVRLLFAGDILLSREVQVEIGRTRESPWKAISGQLGRADWVAGNFEGAIGSASECRVPAGAPCFASLDTSPALLAAAGFKAVSLENNHSGDVGSAGRERTRIALQSAGILGLTFAQSPRFTRVGEATVGMISVSLVKSADGEVQEIPSVELAQKLRLARALANVVVVSIHWGTELQDWPNTAQRAGAEWLVDHGADLVVGHHPHVVQKPDCVHGRPVFYSLGNHVFDQRYPQTKEGLIADCTIRGRQMSCGGLRTHARRGSAVPVVDGGEVGVANCAVTLPATLSISGYELRPQSWSASAAADGVVLEGWKHGAMRWETRRVSLVSIQPALASDGKEALLLALERHPSEMDGEVGLRPHVYAVGERGLIARWRGTALAWPLIDAVVDAEGDVCALHRGDSFVSPSPAVGSVRTMRYRWNGFGFSAVEDGEGRCAHHTFASSGGALNFF